MSETSWLRDIFRLLQEQPSKNDFQLLALSLNILNQKLETRLPNLEVNIKEKFALIDEKLNKFESLLVEMSEKIDSLVSSSTVSSSYLPKLAFPEIDHFADLLQQSDLNPLSLRLNAQSNNGDDKESLDFGDTFQQQTNSNIQFIGVSNNEFVNSHVSKFSNTDLPQTTFHQTNIKQKNENSISSNNSNILHDQTFSNDDNNEKVNYISQSALLNISQPIAVITKRKSCSESTTIDELKSTRNFSPSSNKLCYQNKPSILQFSTRSQSSTPFSHSMTPSSQSSTFYSPQPGNSHPRAKKRRIGNNNLIKRFELKNKIGLAKLNAVIEIHDSVTTVDGLTSSAYSFYGLTLKPMVQCFRVHFHGDADRFIAKWGDTLLISRFGNDCCSLSFSCLVRGSVDKSGIFEHVCDLGSRVKNVPKKFNNF